jgi:predicted alpha/beta hydrolase family esterase
MKKRNQLFLIHGGMTFKSREDYLDYLVTRKISIEKKVRWAEGYLDGELGRKVEIIRPSMPLSENAKYGDWKIHFERHFPKLRKNIILVGSSLGGIFLAKYLSENKFPRRILSTYLICPPFDNSLPDEDLVGGFKLGKDLSLLEKQSKNLYLMFSKDDPVVPLSQVDKYKKKLEKAEIIIYKSKNGHFKIKKFPEFVRLVKEDLKK